MMTPEERLEDTAKRVICISCGVKIPHDRCFYDTTKLEAVKKLIKEYYENKVLHEGEEC